MLFNYSDNNKDPSLCSKEMRGYAQDLLDGINAVQTVGPKALKGGWAGIFLQEALRSAAQTPGYPDVTQEAINQEINQYMSNDNPKPDPSYDEMIDATTALMKPIYEITQWVENEGVFIGCSYDVRSYIRETVMQLNALTSNLNLCYDPLDPNGIYWYAWLTLPWAFYFNQAPEEFTKLLPMAKDLACAILNNKVPK